ncbi:MAG: prolyl oligopeptidase family serine peptidase [Pseudomonadota bacterium]
MTPLTIGAVAAAAASSLFTMAAAQQEESAPMSQDPFVWLEEVEGEQALDWVRGENERSLAILEGQDLFGDLLDEATAILTSDDRVPNVSLRGGFAYNFWQDADHVRGIWRRIPQADYVAGKDEWDVILDVDALAEAEGENWVYEGVECLAPHYARCLITLSRGGSDAAVVREYDIAERAFVAGGFELPEAKSSVAWLDEDTILVGTYFGTETMTESGYARQVRRWSRGQALADAELLFEAAQDDIWSFAMSFYDGEGYRGGVYHGETFYDFNWLVLEEGALARLPLPKKARVQGLASGAFVVALQEDFEDYSAGSVIAVDATSKKTALLYEPTAVSAVEDVRTSDDSVVIGLLDDIKGRALRYTKGWRGWRGRDIDLPVGGVVSLGSMDESTGALLATFEDPLTPETHYLIEGAKAKDFRQAPSFFDSEGMVTRRYEGTSSDGTKIPYTLTALERTLEAGPAPTIQYGYGGFEISILPNYLTTAGKLWVARGGVYVTTNIRGGGEYGPAWHQAGLKTNRQLIYDDFQAISEDLIARGVTTSEQLGIYGGSNGGLLTGVTMTQRPDLYAAVGIAVPLLDMLRYDQLLAGASWVGEYGDPDNPEERAFLERISPYHNLDPQADYPRPFIFTSTKDDRVHPGHARKFARLMQENDQPFLYYENIEGGHSAAANLNQFAHRTALLYAYFADALGLAGVKTGGEE